MRARPSSRAFALVFLTIATPYLAGAGCSSSGSNQDGGRGEPVSFATEVMPIFQQSCALSTSCHGDPGAGPLQPYLGASDSGVDGPTALSRIVNVPSAEDPTMNLVTPGDSAHSFLLHKMDGDQGTLASQCAATAYAQSYPDCGSSMPSGSATLPAATRDTVRAWIEQGAK